MTEADWLARKDPEQMVEFMAGKGSERRHRLLALACSNPCVEENTSRGRGTRAALDLAEQAAEGLIDDRQRQEVRARIPDLADPDDWWDDLRGQTPTSMLLCGDRWDVESVPLEILRDHAFDINAPARVVVGGALHCLFSNPFRPVAFDPRWRTEDVVALARGIYDERAFDRMPLLADALMDAGCDNEDILTHCRSGAVRFHKRPQGMRYRGCWVVDLVLGKE
jgi:hypothetical protein